MSRRYRKNGFEAPHTPTQIFFGVGYVVSTGAYFAAAALAGGLLYPNVAIAGLALVVSTCYVLPVVIASNIFVYAINPSRRLTLARVEVPTMAEICPVGATSLPHNSRLRPPGS